MIRFNDMVQQTKLALDGWWGPLLPDTLHEIAAAFQGSTGAPSETIVATLLSSISALFSKKVVAEGIYGEKTPVLTFFLVASESGEGKSSSVSAVLRSFYEYDSQLRRESNNSEARKAAELELWKARGEEIKRTFRRLLRDGKELTDVQQVLEDHIRSQPRRNEDSNLLITYPTKAGLLAHLANTRFSTFLINPDAGKLFSELMLKNLSYFCSIWSCELIHENQKHQIFHIDKPDLSMLLMLQPLYLKGLFAENSDYRLSGLAARTLLLKSTQRNRVRRNIDNEQAEGVRRKWSDFVYGQLSANHNQDHQRRDNEKRLIKLSEESKCYLVTLVENARIASQPGGELFVMQDYASRKYEHVLRIAALYSLFRNPESLTIEVDDVQRADRFIMYIFTFARDSVYQDSEESRVINNASKIMLFIIDRIMTGRCLYNAGVPVILVSDLQQYGPVRKKQQLDKSISQLIYFGKIVLGPFTYNDNGHQKTRKSVFVLDILPLVTGAGCENFNNPYANRMIAQPSYQHGTTFNHFAQPNGHAGYIDNLPII